MKQTLFLLLIIITVAAGFTPGKSAVTQSAVTFQAKNLGVNIPGTLAGLQANIQFNPANLAASSVEATVDVNTINTDNSSRDDHLKSQDFFDVAHYPKITMRSVSFIHKSGNNYTGEFTLTIKNKSKLIQVPFSYTEKNNVMEFKGAFKINRVDFGVGESSMILSDDVTVNITVALTR